jgi:hypothetical protein
VSIFIVFAEVFAIDSLSQNTSFAKFLLTLAISFVKKFAERRRSWHQN